MPDSTRWRCPICLTIFWSGRAMCAGGWLIYDPAAPPGARMPVHDPTLVLREDRDPAPVRDREPFGVRNLPYVLVVLDRDGTEEIRIPLMFGPFASAWDAKTFAAEHDIRAYMIDAMYPMRDANHLPNR